jgi:hypothetical protein
MIEHGVRKPSGYPNLLHQIWLTKGLQPESQLQRRENVTK